MITNDTVETTETKEAKRRRQYAEAKKRQRAKDASEGARVFSIKLTREQFQAVMEAGRIYSGTPEEFLGRALVTGAKFIANSGNVKGGKARLK